MKEINKSFMIKTMNISSYINKLDSFKNKKVVLIGGTSGIGLELLKHLVNLDAKVILLAVEKEIGTSLKDEYQLEDYIYYDQSSFEAIDRTINELIDKHPDFTTIVLNAGVLGSKKILDNGYLATIGINYIGARYFIDNISPLIKHNVRFVIAGSFVGAFHLNKKIDLKDHNLSTFTQYNVSKIYLEAYFYKLYKDNKYPNIEYVLTEPGLTNSGIIRSFNKVVRFLGKYFLKWFFHSPRKASLCLLTGISDKAHNGDFITPRGLFTLSGYPKIKSFPKKRRRSFLFE